MMSKQTIRDNQVAWWPFVLLMACVAVFSVCQRGELPAAERPSEAKTADTPTELEATRRQLEAMRARAQYFLALLRWKAGRAGEAINVLRQIPPAHRKLEWYLAHRELYGADITAYGHTGEIDSLAFSPDGTLVASGGADNRVRLWDARTGRELKSWQGLDREPNAAGVHASSVQFSPDGSRLAAGCGYGSDIGFQGVIKIWDVQTGKLLQKLDETRWVIRIQFSRDGRRIAYGTLNNTAATVWDLDAGKKLTLKLTDSTTFIHWAFSPDGTLLAAGEFGRTRYKNNRPIENDPCNVVLWDVRRDQVVRTLKGHTTSMSGISFSPDGKRLATLDYDKNVKVWDVQTGDEVKSLSGTSLVGFSRDGAYLLTQTAEKSRPSRTLQSLNLQPVKSSD